MADKKEKDELEKLAAVEKESNAKDDSAEAKQAEDENKGLENLEKSLKKVQVDDSITKKNF